jgi:chaperonin GroES
MANIRPLGDRVIIKRVDSATVTKGGILIPGSAQEKEIQGVVVAVGPGRLHDNGTFQECTVKRGDTVLFSKYGGTEVKIDGVEHIILREEEILGVVEQ